MTTALFTQSPYYVIVNVGKVLLIRIYLSAFPYFQTILGSIGVVCVCSWKEVRNMIKIPHNIGIKCTLKSIKWSIQGWKQGYYFLKFVLAKSKAKRTKKEQNNQS